MVSFAFGSRFKFGAFETPEIIPLPAARLTCGNAAAATAAIFLTAVLCSGSADVIELDRCVLLAAVTGAVGLGSTGALASRRDGDAMNPADIAASYGALLPAGYAHREYALAALQTVHERLSNPALYQIG